MPERTPEDLRAMSDHVLYEMDMLFYCVEQFGPEHVPATATQWQAALLESWGVHARNLTDFLYRPDRWLHDDAFADQYFGEGEWNRMCPEMPESLTKLKDRANKELVHLTYARLLVTDDLKPWELSRLTNDLVPSLQLFAGKVSPKLVTEEFRNRANPRMQAIRHSVATGRPQPPT